MENFTDQHTRNKMETSTEAILEIENTINKKLPIDDLSEIFLHDSYLVGGCVRDAVWNKIIETQILISIQE
ncbi:MAG: hypothetical protein EOM85_02345 [Candidatus Moranbacteria bacterium]|nr:hypothetical protein [Candidatus Moranbacteria bacterium]